MYFVKYYRQRLLSLVNMGLHAVIIRLSLLIHEGEQRYKPYIVGDPWMVSLLNITSFSLKMSKQMFSALFSARKFKRDKECSLSDFGLSLSSLRIGI